MQKNIHKKHKKHQNIIPKKEFTGKNLTRFGGVVLFRRFFERMDLKTVLAVVVTSKRRKDDYSNLDMCFCLLYGLMLGIFRPSHMKELAADKVCQKIAGGWSIPYPWHHKQVSQQGYSTQGIAISMDGRGRVFDNIFIERLWRTVKYEEVYLHDYQNVREAREGLSHYFSFYNTERFLFLYGELHT